MKQITGIRRIIETTQRSGGSGDNWHTTWANDDKQYVALCDGQGWADVDGYTGQSYNTRVYALNGNIPDHKFEHLPGYPDLLSENSPNVNRYYGFGIIAIDGFIHHFLSTSNHPFGEPNPRFVGIKLIYSPNNGRIWMNQNGTTPVVWEAWNERNRDNMFFFKEHGDAFSLITVLQMGRNYEHNRDGYIYLYAPNGNVEGTMNQLVMCRILKKHVPHRSLCEFFVSLNPDGSVEWSKDINDRGIVYTFPSGWVNTKIHPYAWHPSVVYNAQLGLYMMANWGMGCTDDGMWFGKPSYLGFWVAENPWGPWEQVHEDTAWMPEGDPAGRAYQPQIIPKWISDDGKSFWLVFTEFRKGYYCFNYQKVEIITK